MVARSPHRPSLPCRAEHSLPSDWTSSPGGLCLIYGSPLTYGPLAADVSNEHRTHRRHSFEARMALRRSGSSINHAVGLRRRGQGLVARRSTRIGPASPEAEPAPPPVHREGTGTHRVPHRRARPRSATRLSPPAVEHHTPHRSARRHGWDVHSGYRTPSSPRRGRPANDRRGRGSDPTVDGHWTLSQLRATFNRSEAQPSTRAKGQARPMMHGVKSR